MERQNDLLYCHVCGERLIGGGVGFSPFELSCTVCQTAYHLFQDHAAYVTPEFVAHGEPPVILPIALLQDPAHVRHIIAVRH